MSVSSAKVRVTNNQLSVERLIPAPPEAIFDLLADPDRHAETVPDRCRSRVAAHGVSPWETASVWI